MRKWNKVKTLITFMMLACMLLISACGGAPTAGSTTAKSDNSSQAQTTKASSTADAPKAQPEQTQAPAAPAGKPQITVTPPAGWEAVPGSTALVQYMKGTCSFIGTCDVMPSEANTPDTFMDFAKVQYNKTFDGIKFGEVKNVTIDGAQGKSLDFSCNISGMTMKYTIYYAFKNGAAYTFTCGGLAEEFDKLKGDYDAFIKSAKLK